MEKEKESLNKSDAVALKMRDSVLSKELEEQRRNKDDKEKFLASKQEQYVDAKTQIKDEEDRKFDKETEINSLLEDMQEEADTMGFQEFAFMAEELQGILKMPINLNFIRSSLRIPLNRFQREKICCKNCRFWIVKKRK
ncbi:MAG: hypothetical protein ACLUGF_10530 [Clostridium sp.]